MSTQRSSVYMYICINCSNRVDPNSVHNDILVDMMALT